MSNDTEKLTAITQIHGPALKIDFPALTIGIAEYDEGPTGCTVFSFSHEVRAAIDIRGGSPSTFTTDNPNFIAGERLLEAICFTGGSVYGLEAVTGVTAELLKTTSEVENPEISADVLGLLASELAWDAVLSTVQS